MPTRTELDALMAQFEEMWGHLETLFDKIEAADGWGQKHGPDWTFADVPYHGAYINRDVIARGLQSGPDIPEPEQELLPTPDAIHAWNAGKFAERPAGQSAAQSAAQWRESCDEIRRLVFGMDDAGLERPFFLPIMRGWLGQEAGD